jgi:hypothetical protein
MRLSIFVLIRFAFGIVACVTLSGCERQPESLTSIKTIKSFKEVNFDDIKPGSLVLFDVDETLIVPASVTLRTKTKDQHQRMAQTSC